MTLQEIIEMDLRKAMVNDPAKRDLLRVVLAELTRKSKVSTDVETIAILKKQIESAKLCGTLSEIPILEAYLPLAMPEEEVKSMIESIIAENGYVQKDRGPLMGKIKVALGSDFDGSVVNRLVGEIFA
jgi:uncharacterized protein YqeY